MALRFNNQWTAFLPDFMVCIIHSSHEGPCLATFLPLLLVTCLAALYRLWWCYLLCKTWSVFPLDRAFLILKVALPLPSYIPLDRSFLFLNQSFLPSFLFSLFLSLSVVFFLPSLFNVRLPALFLFDIMGSGMNCRV